MGHCIRTKIKKYKNTTYKYFELVHTYRDPNNKKRVVSEFKCHLGKDKAEIRQKLERYKQEATGRFSVERIAKTVEKELAKGIKQKDIPDL